jgi:hypothetical protein
MAFNRGLHKRLDLVFGGGDGAVWDCGLKDYYPFQTEPGQ